MVTWMKVHTEIQMQASQALEVPVLSPILTCQGATECKICENGTTTLGLGSWSEEAIWDLVQAPLCSVVFGKLCTLADKSCYL